MQYEIKHIHENLGLTVVYVTHDQSEALTMSNRIAVFDDGIIQQLASPEVLYEKPHNAFVASFIGENNKLVGDVLEDANGFCKVRVGSEVIESITVNHNGVGGKATLSLRPERVFIEPTSEQCPNIVSAEVEEVIYLGDHVRTRINLLGHDEFIVKTPNSADHEHLEVGQKIRVGWLPDDCRALDA